MLLPGHSEELWLSPAGSSSDSEDRVLLVFCVRQKSLLEPHPLLLKVQQVAPKLLGQAVSVPVHGLVSKVRDQGRGGAGRGAQGQRGGEGRGTQGQRCPRAERERGQKDLITSTQAKTVLLK